MASKPRSKALRNASPNKYFRSAVVRGRAKGRMLGYGKTMMAAAEIGDGAEAVQLNSLLKKDRIILATHWNLVGKVLDADTPRERRIAGEKLQRFVDQNPTVGGFTLTSDINDIIRARQADPDIFNPENAYPDK